MLASDNPITGNPPHPATQRLRVTLRGRVQGVGFRPFVYRLADTLGLNGWVQNTGAGLLLEVEGPPATLRQFLLRLESDKPRHASIQGLEPQFLDPHGFHTFTILASTSEGRNQTQVPPDIATCPDCLADIRDPANRRFRYPFTNCTHCGPRYSIIAGIPYDRPQTSMRSFPMCPACHAEYDNPRDRRFHAQPNACPACGPTLSLLAPDGHVLAVTDAALRQTVTAIQEGRIVAIMGLGGFHLAAAADNPPAILRLRTLKAREEKPFALMYPDLTTVRRDCHLDPLEQRLLTAPEAPIVLLQRRPDARIADAVAPGHPLLGVMLPYTPLHHLLLADLASPIVATSGNRRDEPICTAPDEALRRLTGLADLFLVHNRPILRHVDDSIVRVVLDRELILRRARGYAPLPIHSHTHLAPTLATGAHLKNTVALADGHQIFLSQHLGDLETAESYDAFRRQTRDLQQLFTISPTLLAHDLHPDYLSTQYALQQAADSGQPHLAVQHHFAHIVACMADNGLDGTVLGVAWDGVGLGTDNQAWGGEFLVCTPDAFTRFAHLRPLPLPGGDNAAREPRRAALGLLHAAGLLHDPRVTRLPVMAAFTPTERETLSRMLDRRLHCPETTSAGRLFDAVAALLNLRQQAAYEGQAAMLLEFAATSSTPTTDAYPLPLQPATGTNPAQLDWGPLLNAILDDLNAQTPTPIIAARFHNALAQAIATVARHAQLPRVALSGGCFQNRYLLEQTVKELNAAGLQAYWHQRVPPNDGGIALGQALHAGRRPREQVDHVSGHTGKN